MPRQWVLHRLGCALWSLPLAQVEGLEPELHTLGTQVDALLSVQGWTTSDAPPVGYWPAYYGTAYMQAMTPDLAAWRARLQESLTGGVRQWSTLRLSGLRAAFGYAVTEDPDEIIPEATWQALLDELGYTYEPGAWEVKVKPLALPPDAAQRLRQALDALPVYHSPQYGALLQESAVLAATRTALDVPALSGEQEAQLRDTGLLGHELLRRGYARSANWIATRNLTPPSVGKPHYDYFLPRILATPQEAETVMWADGFGVHVPVLVRDGETVVYLELVGPRQAVHANWAALRSHNRSVIIAGARLKTAKSDGLTTLKASLPTGWDHWCLIHQQASHTHLVPGAPCYLVDLGLEPLPPTFFPLLSRALALPVLPQWLEHLWLEGQVQGLIQPLSVDCIGRGGWRIDAHKTKAWAALISAGLRAGTLIFEEQRCLPT